MTVDVLIAKPTPLEPSGFVESRHDPLLRLIKDIHAAVETLERRGLGK